VAIGMFLTVMDQSGVNIALPQISEHFDADIPTVQWLSLGYVLSTSAAIMPVGRFSDMAGRKRVFVAGTAVFISCAALGGVSNSLALLISAKVLQGIASAAISANGMALIMEVFPENNRGKAMGMYMAIIGTGAVTGPIVGGLLVDAFGWRSVFFAGVPVGILGIIATLLVLKGRTAEESTAESGVKFDWLGAALSSGSLVAFLLAMTNAWRMGWGSPEIVGGTALALVLLVGFVLWELKTTDPMLDLGLFNNQIFSLAIGARFLSFLGGSSVYFLMPFYLIQGLQFSPSKAALMMVPTSIAMATLGPLSGLLSDRIGTRWPAVFGMSCSTVAMFIFSRLTMSTPEYLIIIAMMISGIGMASFGSPNSSAIMGAHSREKYGIVTAFVNLTRTSANVTGVALATTLVTITMGSMGYEPSLSAIGEGGGEGVRVAFIAGMARAFLISSGLMAGATVLSLLRSETKTASSKRQTDQQTTT
jgi:EmrB/QacA subfamily drug resistance transporter